MKKKLGIFCVSLEKDIKRRETLSLNFKNYYNDFNIIYAVDGRKLSAKEYFEKSFLTTINLKNRLMTPSELGCTLSHIEALSQFLKSEFDFALILEDDVIGNDESIEKVKNQIQNLKENTILICGGQNGLNDKYLYGKKINDLFLIPKFSYSSIFRTCCYLVDKKAANWILDYQKKYHNLADRWNVILKNSHVNFYFIDIFSHSVDLENSHIESERNIISNISFLKKRNLLKNAIIKIYKVFSTFYLKILKYEKINAK